jgi:hypothetical protein
MYLTSEQVSQCGRGGFFLQFLGGNISNFCKRVFYSYFLRGFSIASLELPAGLLLLLFGVTFGAKHACLGGWPGAELTGSIAGPAEVARS